MSADVIQFVPRPNPNREQPLIAQATSLVGFLNALTAKDEWGCFVTQAHPHTETESYSAPDGDCA